MARVDDRRAKIICTLGPASSSRERIRELVDAGMDVARLNFSHGSHDTHRRLIATVREVAQAAGRPVGILQDLQGPKIRLGQLAGGGVQLQTGHDFTLTLSDVEGTASQAQIHFAELLEAVEPGDPVLLNDGRVELEVIKLGPESVTCKVVHGGPLRSRSGVNLPGRALPIELPTAKDRRDLELGIAHGVDMVALSFVQHPNDVPRTRREIQRLGGTQPVIAKIERPQAVAALEQVLETVDGIMVARGDLGVEMRVEEVPPIQKRIIDRCNRLGIPVITATQMLESMVSAPHPTRAEASDVANAILDGSDAVMLSGETAAGEFPVQAVSTMARIITITEASCAGRRAVHVDFEALDAVEQSPSVAIGYAARQTASLVDASAIVCLTQSGTTASMISRFRPETPILAVTPSATTLQRIALLWGVRGFQVEEGFGGDNLDDAVKQILQRLVELGAVAPGATLVVTAGVPFSARRGTNMLRVESAPHVE